MGQKDNGERERGEEREEERGEEERGNCGEDGNPLFQNCQGVFHPLVSRKIHEGNPFWPFWPEFLLFQRSFLVFVIVMKCGGFVKGGRVDFVWLVVLKGFWVASSQECDSQ